MNKLDRFVWIDMEMTGLHPERDVILEIATIITDSQLNIIEHGASMVIHQSDEALAVMSDHVADIHQRSGLIQAVRVSSITVHDAMHETMKLIQRHCQRSSALLAGNSVWQDKRFLYTYMPEVVAYLHYRIIDVTTVKELITRWFPEAEYALFPKKETHRAREDILESIAELQHYRTYFFKHTA